MEEFPHGIALAWSFPPVPAVGILLTLVIYLRGWKLLQRTRSAELPSWRALSFVCGMISLWLALASPIDALDDFLLSAHMLQHFILMSVAPPLLVLGAPAVPMLRGLPRRLITGPLRPVFASRFLHRAAHFITRPVVAWLLMNLSYVGWHFPRAFELTLHSEVWHSTEHMTFLLTSILFWWIVISPWPHRTAGSRWAVIPFLLTADLVNTALSATLAFSGRVLYYSYGAAERVSSLTPLQDQVLAGSEMWVLNSSLFLIPVVVIVIRLLSPQNLHRSPATLSSTNEKAASTHV